VATIVHTENIVARVLTRRTERKIEDVRGENQFGYIRQRATSGAIGMLRITSERTLLM
jgi:hypothetical protein